MGSSSALPLLLLSLVFPCGVWSLNPDDPNVCSHWERWGRSRLRFYERERNFTSGPESDGYCWSWNFSSTSARRRLNQSSRSILKVRTAVLIWHGLRCQEIVGVAASNEMRRQIDQCTLVPINHDSHRAWIIISCAGWCHIWEIRRNNFRPRCKGEERKPGRYIIQIIAWPRWEYWGPWLHCADIKTYSLSGLCWWL